jgi:hypothetical protein
VSFPDQYNEGHLKRVFGLGEVAEDPPAGTEDHRGVPADQAMKGRLIVLVGITAEEFSIGHGVGYESGGHSKEIVQGGRHDVLAGVRCTIPREVDFVEKIRAPESRRRGRVVRRWFRLRNT